MVKLLSFMEVEVVCMYIEATEIYLVLLHYTVAAPKLTIINIPL